MRFSKFIVSTLVIILSGLARAEDTAGDFYNTLSSLCGETFVGEMTFPTDGQDSFKGKQLVAEIAHCDQTEIRVPFTVGEDRSRTWIISRTESGLRLKHDHRHKDGSPDEITNYGGDSSETGNDMSQSFPADTFTQELIPAAATNVWTLSLSEDFSQLTYHLTRHGKPRFTAVLKKAD